MQLFFTDDSFKQNGIRRPGIPFLCDAQMRLVDAANNYFRYIAIISGRTSSPRTWETYGNHLYEFFSFLESNELAWDRIGLVEMANWRDTMRIRQCSRSTVNQRLRCAQAFYQWAAESGLIERSPIVTQSVRATKRGGLLAHLDTSANLTAANVLTLPHSEAAPKFLYIFDAFAFISALTSHTQKHMAYLALLAGLRRDEIISLSYRVLPNPCGLDIKKLVPMRLDANLTPTKGSKTRTVMMPYDLVASLWNYFCIEWPIRHKKFERREQRESNRLFLSSDGKEYSPRYLNNAFAANSKKSGIVCHPHMLRHTFGTYEFLRVERKYTVTQALLWVRDRMGHTSISTTEKYVHTAALLKNDEIDLYQSDLLGAFSKWP